MNAPGKEFVNIVGSFNDWEISNNYLMKYDQAQDKFWYELSGLNTKSYHSYQYLVDGSVFIADPYSPIILDFNGDSYICKTSECGFTSFPSYPKDNRHAATMFKIDDDFIWEDDGFTPPDKENLIIYELLVRDFHPDKSFSAVYEKLDYLEEYLISFHKICKVGFSCDFMSTYVDFKHPGSYHTKEQDVINIIKKFTKRYIIRNDYLDFEFMIYVFK